MLSQFAQSFSMHRKLQQGMLHKHLATWYLVFRGSCLAHYTSGNLKKKKTEALKCNTGDFDAFIIMSDKARQELEWWVTHADSSYNVVTHGEPTIVLITNASSTGWGYS